MEFDEVSGQHLLIVDGGAAHRVGYYIVDVLHEYYLRINVVEVADQGAVASGPEHHTSVGIAEGCIVLICGNSVGRSHLLGEPDLDFHAHALLDGRNSLLEFGLECLAVVGRHSEVKVDRTVGLTGCLRPLHELLLDRSANGASFGAVEGQQPLGQLAVVHPLREDY